MKNLFIRKSRELSSDVTRGHASGPMPMPTCNLSSAIVSRWTPGQLAVLSVYVARLQILRGTGLIYVQHTTGSHVN